MLQSDPTSNRSVPEDPGQSTVPGWIWRPGVLILAVVVGLITAGALLNAWANHLDVRLHAPRNDRRILLMVGIDSHSLAPEGTTDLGELGDEYGSYTDLILILRRREGRIRAASTPRDLVIEVVPNKYDHLVTSQLRNLQAFVGDLCRSLAMSTDHVVAVNLREFVILVDAAGGVDATLEHSLQGGHTCIDLPVGTQRLDGRTVLGFARSRRGEILVDDTWIADPEGAAGRQQRGGGVFRALQGRLSRNPVTLHSLVWRMLPEASLSDGTSLLGLAGSRGLPGGFARIPVEGGRDADDWVVTVNDQTRAALTETGPVGGCSV